MSAYDVVCHAIEATTGYPVQSNGSARCPAHDDRKPSLSIDQGDVGVKLHCHAGCTYGDIMAAVGLTEADGFDDSDPWETTPKSQPVTYDYTDANGDLLFQVVRSGGKRFWQRRPDGHGDWIDNTNGIDQKPLYRLPKVLEAIANGETIYVVEGEKDVHALERAGYVATTNPGGVGMGWRPHHTEALKGATVTVIADDDTAGLEHAWKVATDLVAAGCDVELFKPHEGHKDISEHLGAERNMGDLVALDLDTEPKATPSSWAPVDISTVIDTPPPEPTFLRFDHDRHGLIYPGKDHVLYGASESGKSWVAMIAVAQALDGGHKAAYVDYEDDARSVTERLQALGVDKAVLCDHDRYRYVSPSESVREINGRFNSEAVGDLSNLIHWGPDLVILDGTTEALALEGLSSNLDTDYAQWAEAVPRRFRAVGAAVVNIDHTPKDGPRTEIGTHMKRAGLSGASYYVNPIKRLGRPTGSSHTVGLIQLQIAKDRAGFIRGRYPGDFQAVADIGMTAWGDDRGITYKIEPGGKTTYKPIDEMAIKIVEYLTTYDDGGDGESQSAIAQGINRNRTDPDVAGKLAEMVKAGHLTFKKKGMAKLHSLTDSGRERYKLQILQVSPRQAPDQAPPDQAQNS